jgi:hypothetical protein
MKYFLVLIFLFLMSCNQKSVIQGDLQQKGSYTFDSVKPSPTPTKFLR